MATRSYFGEERGDAIHGRHAAQVRTWHHDESHDRERSPGGTDGDEMDAEGATTTVLSLER
jgi:hypothetical protein